MAKKEPTKPLLTANRMDIAIKVHECDWCENAHVCEHVHFETGSVTSPGDLVICEACEAKLNKGAAVIGDGYQLKPTGRGDWLKAEAKAGQ